MNVDPTLIVQKELKYSICSFLGGYVGGSLYTDNRYYETIGFLIGGLVSPIFSSFSDMYHGINQNRIKAKLVKSLYHHVFSTFVGATAGLAAVQGKKIFTFENSVSFYISAYIISLIYKYSNLK